VKSLESENCWSEKGKGKGKGRYAGEHYSRICQNFIFLIFYFLIFIFIFIFGVVAECLGRQKIKVEKTSFSGLSWS